MAASSLAFSEYLVRTVPEGFTLIHYFGLKSGSRVQNILTTLKIALILVLVLSGFAFGEGSFEP